MGHTTGNDLLEHFTNITEPMNYSSIIHLSMDWPSVNHKFYRDLKEYRERKNCLRWLTLEVVIFIFYMEQFKSGFESTDWELKTTITPLLQKKKLNFHKQWLEDKSVTDRLLEIWLNIVKTVKYWTFTSKI